MLSVLRGPVPVLPCLWSSSCSPFLVELTAPSFLLPRTSLLFYYSTDSVFLGVFLPPYLTVTSLSKWFVSDTFQVSFSRCCTFSKLLLEMDWMVDFLVEAFFSICTLSSTCLCSKWKRVIENNFIPSPTPMHTLAAAAEESWAAVTKAHFTSVPSGVRPLLSQTRGSGPWVKS